MLFLLRKVRKSLLKENKITNYLLYAIGEIVLVVIGIMIAVSINNWNQDRNERATEIKYFRNLKTDLQADLISLDRIIDFGSTKIQSARNLRTRSDRDSVGSLYDFSKVIQQLIFVGGFKPNRSTFEEMVSSGNFSNLRNDSLKLKLIELKQMYELIDGAQEHVRNDYDVFLENFQTHVDWGSFHNLEKTLFPGTNLTLDSTRIERDKQTMEQDVSGLLDDKVFLNNIFLIEMNFSYMVPLYGETKSQIDEVIAILDEEIMN